MTQEQYILASQSSALQRPGCPAPYPVGIYGWRKRCLYFFILLLLVTMIVNLALTIWILKVMNFTVVGDSLYLTNLCLYIDLSFPGEEGVPTGCRVQTFLAHISSWNMKYTHAWFSYYNLLHVLLLCSFLTHLTKLMKD